jgi:hypothetical protein
MNTGKLAIGLGGALILIAGQLALLPGTPGDAMQAGPPDIEVAPSALEVTLEQSRSDQEDLQIANVGQETLTFEITEGRVLGTLSAFEWRPLRFPSEKIEAGLRESILSSDPAPLTALVYLTKQADLSPARGITNWQDRGRFVHETLLGTAQATQGDLLSLLEFLRQAGTVIEYHPYYIVNAVAVKADGAAFDQLAGRADVAYIETMGTSRIPDPLPGAAEGVLAVEWGVLRIGADRVWSDFGVRGEGVVVANIDTGVKFDHAALVSQYRGTLEGTHDYNWFDPNGAAAPFDNNGHGTHTMGSMVGSDGSGNQVGVAPEAQWIAAKGCASNYCSDTDLLDSAEWILAPYPIGASAEEGDPTRRPHIVNNSWGGGGGNLWYQASVQAWRAAGIFPAFSAGNSGPGSGTVGSPGDYAESFASGATDSGDTIASFSSRGPSSLTDETKPDVSSPGVNVRSAWNDGGYRAISGTSMASPHTAGCAALILSTSPDLGIETVEDLLTGTAVDLGSSGPDFTYGHGRIDCYEAVTEARGADVAWLTVEPVSGSVEPGGVQNVSVGFDADLALGEYKANLVISNNDPDENPVTVPVTLRVTDSSVTPTPTSGVPTTLTPTRTPIIPTDTATPTPSPTASPMPPTFTPSPTAAPGVVFFDDFERDLGWQRDPFGSDTATTGGWARANPQGTSYQGYPMQLDLSASGTQDLVTGPLAGSSVGSYDVDSGVTSIRSPEIELPSGAQLTLSFSYYLAHLFNASAEDYLRVTVVGSAGRELLFEEVGGPENDAAIWTDHEVDLSEYAGERIYLLVEAADAGDPSLVEAAIDDVAITSR